MVNGRKPLFSNWILTSSTEYRIFYRLRNFDQHCGNLVSRITGQVLPDDTRQYLVLADRDRLLREFKEWKQEEITYLKSCEQYFDIRPLIDVFQNCIIEIHEKTMQIHSMMNSAVLVPL